MLENLSWSFFVKTGNIETYMEYIQIRNSISNTVETKKEPPKSIPVIV